jgi:hypothetical protein
VIEPAKRADTVRHAATDPERTDDPAAADGSYTEIMSFGQQRLWVLDQLLPDRSLYNTPRVQCLLGPLDVSALEAGIGEILRRHDALRTSFSVVDGEPRQRVAPPAPFHLPVDDLSRPAGMPEAEARRRAEAFCRAPFDLEHGPLCTALLLRLGPDRHWLKLSTRMAGRNTEGIGSTVIVKIDGGPTQTFPVHRCQSFLGTDDPRLPVGLGKADHATVKVVWPGPELKTTTYENLAADAYYVLSDDGKAVKQPLPQ